MATAHYTTVGFAWNGRIWTGKMLYESEKMDKALVRRIQRDNHVEGVRRKRRPACAVGRGTAWKTEVQRETELNSVLPDWGLCA